MSRRFLLPAALAAVLVGGLTSPVVDHAPAEAAVVRPAFPGAMGFGAATPGGRGGRVLQVTNLKDSGPGSLRAAMEASGPRTVVFRVAGTIRLRSRIEVDNPFLTVAGQTAPGEGVTLRIDPRVSYDKGVLSVETHDVIIRYLRLRPGPNRGADDSNDGFVADGPETYRIILDHLSMSWAVDEVVNTYDHSRNITVQNSIISEALSNAGHPEGEHSKGMLAGGEGARNVSILRNLFVSNKDRNPQISGLSVADVRNNVVYNYGDGSGGGVTLLSSSKGEPRLNWVGNFYKPGPASPRNRSEFDTYVGSTGETHKFYAGRNLRWTPSGAAPARVEQGAIGRVSSRFAVPRTRTLPPRVALKRVLRTAGASRARDAVDERLVRQFRRGTGRLIDSPAQVGGYPTLATGRPYRDADADGMANAWEVRRGLNPHRDDAAGDVDGDGWTNLEEFLNGRARRS